MDGEESQGMMFLLQACEICGIMHNQATEPHGFHYLEDDNYEELRDPISLEPFWEPVTLNANCKHVFSRDSITAAIELRGCCPIDKSPQALSDIETAPLVIHNLLNKLKVFCPNQCSELTIERGQLTTHLNICPLSKVVCQQRAEGISCQAVLNQSEILGHHAECPCRMIACDRGCNSLILITDRDTHNCTRTLLKRIATLQDDSNALKRLKSVNSQLYIAKWDQCPEPQESCPFDIAMSSSHLFSIDGNGTRILVFDLEGVFKRAWDVAGIQTSIAVFDDEVYVTGLPVSSGKRKVQVYSQEGVTIRSWTRKGKRSERHSQSPSRLVISNKGEVYIADKWCKNVQVFDKYGVFLRKWNYRGESQLTDVKGFAISSYNDGDDAELFVTHHHFIEVFSENGSNLRTLHVERTDGDDEQEIKSSVVAISNAGEMFMSDSSSNSVQVLDNNDGHYIRQMDSFDGLSGIAFSNFGDVYVLDNKGIQVFTS